MPWIYLLSRCENKCFFTGVLLQHLCWVIVCTSCLAYMGLTISYAQLRIVEKQGLTYRINIYGLQITDSLSVLKSKHVNDNICHKEAPRKYQFNFLLTFQNQNTCINNNKKFLHLIISWYIWAGHPWGRSILYPLSNRW